MSGENDGNTGREIQYSSDPVELVEQIAADLPDEEREAMLAEARSFQGLDPLTGYDLNAEGDDKKPDADAKDGDDDDAGDDKPKDGAEGDDKPKDGAEGDDKKPDADAKDGDDDDAGDDKPKDGDDKPGVKTADGESVLDHSVLVAARAEAERARAAAAAAEARAEEAERARAAADKGDDSKTDSAAEKLKEAIATLRENEGDAVADAYEALAGVVTQKDEHIAELEGRLDRQDQSTAQEVQQNSQRAIDANPTLAKWQAEFLAAEQGVDGKSGLMWAKAEALDEVLAQSPEWRGRSLSDRFAEVVRILEPGAAPGSGAPSDDAPKDNADAKGDDKKPDAKAKSEDRKPKEDKAPESISDLPSGDTPDSPLTKFENMAPQDIEAAIAANPERMAEFDALMSQVN